jgi:short-subunit dehydrogenase
MDQQVALVTGASSGIGEAIAVALCKKGYLVYAGARRIDRMKHLEEMGVCVLSIDVTSEESMKAVINQIELEAGMVNILINNAGYGAFGAFEDVPVREARHQIEVNLFGLARMTQLVLPKMRENKHGKIINISSVAGRFGEAYGSWYHASKFAVEGLSDSLALELYPFNIDVVTIEPGAIRTEWSEIAANNLIKNSSGGPYGEMAKKKAAAIHLFNSMKRASEPEVVAKKIVRIIRKRHPRFRYAIGGGARQILWLRHLTSDKIFYNILSKFIG